VNQASNRSEVADSEKADWLCLLRTGVDGFEFGERLDVEIFRDWAEGDLLVIFVRSMPLSFSTVFVDSFVGVSGIVVRAEFSMACLRFAEPGLSPASDFCHFAGGLRRPKSISSSNSHWGSRFALASGQSVGLG
jgi:hypothetical protein